MKFTVKIVAASAALAFAGAAFAQKGETVKTDVQFTFILRLESGIHDPHPIH